MISLKIVAFVVFSIWLMLWWFFRIKNRKITRDFTEAALAMEISLQKHTKQIEVREQGLNRYDFMKYNLNEALIIQPKIKL